MVETRGPQAAGTAYLFLVLTWIFVLLRCYCRIAIVRRFGSDDYLSVITQVALLTIYLGNNETDKVQVFFTFYSASVLLSVHYGAGRHVADILPPMNIVLSLKVTRLP